MSEGRDWNRVRNWNEQIIEEFRTSGGRLGGHFEGAPVLLLHTAGAKSGLERVNPMMYLDLDGHRYVFASAGGASTHPDWYHNLVAHPEVTVEAGTETYPAIATPVTGEERDRIYAEQARRYAQFARYETMANRVIPVVELCRSLSLKLSLALARRRRSRDAAMHCCRGPRARARRLPTASGAHRFRKTNCAQRH